MSGIRILVLLLPFLFLDGAFLKPDGFRKPQPGKPWVPPTLTNLMDDKYKQADPGRSFDLLYQTPPPPLVQWPTQTPTIPFYNPWTNSTPSTPYNNPWYTQSPSTPSYMPLQTPAPSNQVDLSNGFRCPQAYGNYKYSNKCDEYIQCRNFIPLAYKCPAGLQFNRFSLWTDNPCDHPSKVQCYETPAVQTITTTPAPFPLNTPAPATIVPRDSTTWCPQPYGYFRQPNECSSYVECQNAVPRAYTCPFGLHFNSKVQWPDYPCDYSSRAQCNEQLSNPTTPTIPTTTPPPQPPPIAVTAPYPQYQVQPNYQCPQSNGFFRHSNQCGEYVECKNYIPRTYTCPAGLHFNPRVQWTDYPCDSPSKAQCYTEPPIQITSTTTTTTTTAAPQTTPAPALTPVNFSCPQPHGYFRQSDQCGEYVECKNYVPRTYACPTGLHFNSNVEWTDYPCDHPSRAKCK